MVIEKELNSFSIFINFYIKEIEMSNYVWKQVESIRQDMVSVLKDSGFEVMLMPNKLTISRGNEKVVEVNTKSTAPKELVDAASDSLYYHQNIAMRLVIYTWSLKTLYLNQKLLNADWLLVETGLRK